MIQLYTQQYTGSTSQTLFHKLSSSMMQLLALAVLFFAIGMSQRVQAQAISLTPQVDAGSLTTVTSTGNIAVPQPIGLEVGDLILVNVSSRTQSATLTADGTSSGFVQFGSSTSSTNTVIPRVFGFWKIATATDVSNPTYTFNAGGSALNRGYYVTAVRVAAGTFDATTPIVSGGVSTEASTSTTVTSISLPELTSLPAQSVLMGFHATFGSSSNINAPVGMTALNTSTPPPSQLLATQSFPSGGNTGAKEWSWTTARTAAGMIYALNPLSVPCNDITGGLSSTTGGTFGIGNNATVTLQGDATLLRAEVTYTITYNLSGANSGTYTASATDPTAGTLSFTIPASALSCEGATTATVTAIQAQGCPSPVSISANNNATVNMSPVILPQVVSGSLTTASGSGNIAVPRPIGLQEGDLIIVNVSSTTQAGTLTRSGYTLIGSSTTGGSTTTPRAFAYYKIADATDVNDATYTFTAGGLTTSRGFYASAAGATAGNDAATYAYYKIAGGAEPTSYAFTTTGVSTNWRVESVRVTGHNPTNPIGNANGTYSSASVNLITTQIPQVPNRSLVVFSLTTFNTPGAVTKFLLHLKATPIQANTSIGILGLYSIIQSFQMAFGSKFVTANIIQF